MARHTDPREVAVAGAAVGFLVAFLLAGAVAHCQPPADTAEAQAMRVGGVEGVWLPLSEARDALEAVRTRPGYQERVRLLTEALRLADSEVASLRRVVALGERQAATWAGVVTSATEARQRAEADLEGRWPGWAWMVIGGVLVAGLVVAFGLAFGV